MFQDEPLHRVVTYLRQSVADEASLKVQKEQLNELCRRYFALNESSQLVGEFCDVGYSLETLEVKRQLWQLLEMVRDHQVDTIICVSGSRVLGSSNPLVLSRLRQALANSRVRIFDHSGLRCLGGGGDQKGAAPLLRMLAQQAAVAESFSIQNRLRSARLSRVINATDYVPPVPAYGFAAAKTDSAKPNTATSNTAASNTARTDTANNGFIKSLGSTSRRSRSRPRRKLVIVPEEAAVVLDIYRLFLGELPQTVTPPLTKTADGLTPYQIAGLLNSSGFDRSSFLARCPSGQRAEAKWSRGSVLAVLKKPLYAGRQTVVFDNSPLAEGAEGPGLISKTFSLPAIVSEEVWERAQLKLATRGGQRHFPFSATAAAQAAKPAGTAHLVNNAATDGSISP